MPQLYSRWPVYALWREESFVFGNMTTATNICSLTYFLKAGRCQSALSRRERGKCWVEVVHWSAISDLQKKSWNWKCRWTILGRWTRIKSSLIQPLITLSGSAGSFVANTGWPVSKRAVEGVINKYKLEASTHRCNRSDPRENERTSFCSNEEKRVLIRRIARIDSYCFRTILAAKRLHI